MRTVLYCVVMQLVVVSAYRCLGTDKLSQNVGKELPILAA